jgi:hypothetical protein
LANLKITDEFGLNTSLDLRDDSPLAQAKLTHLASIGQPLSGEVNNPIDQTSLKGFSFGIDCSSPSALIGNATNVTLGTGACGAVSIVRAVNKTLFDDDTFWPTIEIKPDQCWIGLELDITADADLQGQADGFGIGVKGTAKLGATTYTLIHSSNGRFPSFLDALKTALDHFYIPSSADALCNQAMETVCATELSGTVTFSGSYQLPVAINALASADLDFNYKISVAPETTLKISGSIAISGDLIVRSQNTDNVTLRIGIYKKRGSVLTASFAAEAGIGVDHGSTDLSAGFLNTVFRGVDSTKAGITGKDAENLNAALKECIDRSLSIAVNASCSAAVTDEPAVVYEVDLSSGSTDETTTALKAALRGDWTRISQLGNARLMRNIVTDAKEYKHKIGINLFGLYNAATIESYVRSCTILHDENGQVAVIDKTRASRITVAATPYAADTDKLRVALAQDFLSTATYAVVASRVNVKIVTQQSYFSYHQKLTRQEMRDHILLGAALNLMDKNSWDSTLSANPVFPHARISTSAKYNTDPTLGLFFANPAQHQPRSRVEIERIGRDAMIAVIDPADPAGIERLAVLRNDQIWNAMNANGNMGSFGFIPGLEQLAPPVLGAVAADWASIAWLADSITQAAPKLADLLTYLDSTPAGDFSRSPEFTAKSKAFQNVLGSVTRKTNAAFAGGWGMAVVFALAGKRADRTMDISWSSITRHYEANS